MPKTKVAITLDSTLVERLDELVRDARFPSRSQAIETAVAEQLQRIDALRLAQECSKLDPIAEQAMADEGLNVDVETWPEY